MVEIIKEQTHFLSIVRIKKIYFNLLSIMFDFCLLPFWRFFRLLSFIFLTHEVNRGSLRSKLGWWFEEPFLLFLVGNLGKKIINLSYIRFACLHIFTVLSVHVRTRAKFLNEIHIGLVVDLDLFMNWVSIKQLEFLPRRSLFINLPDSIGTSF